MISGGKNQNGTDTFAGDSVIYRVGNHVVFCDYAMCGQLFSFHIQGRKSRVFCDYAICGQLFSFHNQVTIFEPRHVISNNLTF